MQYQSHPPDDDRLGFSPLARTTMSNPYLLPEILDCVVDLLHDEPEALKTCCLVSKSWVPRTRRHLFADIKLRSVSDLRAWKKVFPDTVSSPAHRVRSLSVGCPEFAVAADAEEGGWTQPFSGVTSLDVDNGTSVLKTSPAPLIYKFISTLKSLRMSPILLPCPHLFDLIHSSPLLEDLTLTGQNKSLGNDENPDCPQAIVPLSSPPLTGTLSLSISGGMGDFVRRLLDLPNGLHFRRLAFSWDRNDLRWVAALVEVCSHALEFLYVACISGDASVWHSRPHRRLTRVSRWVGLGFDRPLEGDKAKKCSFSVQITERRLDHRGASNHHSRISRFSTSHNFRTFPPHCFQRR